MLDSSELLFQVGAIMLIAFAGAAIATKSRQSVILGYILAGILIGPYIYLDLGVLSYEGLFKDTAFIEQISQFGLILLMFFVGLEFSFTKLKRTKAPATLLAVMNLGINMFAGILLGTALGWPLIDTIFLAGVVAMSSCAITAKSLIELKRLENPETEFLLGMVIVEDFLSMVLLTIAGGLMVNTGSSSIDLPTLIIGIVAFYGFFIIMAAWVIPRVVDLLKKIRSDEMFVLFALGIVFLSAAIAEVSHVPGIIGAFFIGMVFAETNVSARFHDKLVSFRDAFVALFFVSFGMMIDPSRIPDVIGMVAIAVPIVIINDVFITAALSYFFGFSSRSAVSMGTSLCGRGAESVMYASVGSSAAGSTRGAELYPFAGAFCFVMSAITPIMMRKSMAFSEFLGKRVPRYLAYSGAVISRTFGKAIMPSSLKLYHSSRRTVVSLALFFCALSAVIVTSGLDHIISFAVGLLSATFALKMLNHDLHPIVQHTNYTNIGVAPRDRASIRRFLSSVIYMSLLTIMTLAFVFPYMWQLTLAMLVAYLIAMIVVMRKNYLKTFDENFKVNPARFVEQQTFPWEKSSRSRRIDEWD